MDSRLWIAAPFFKARNDGERAFILESTCALELWIAWAVPRNDDKATFLKKLVLLQYDFKGCSGVLARFGKFRVGVILSGNDCPKFFNGVNCSPKTESRVAQD